jgi:hypothetical protein
MSKYPRHDLAFEYVMHCLGVHEVPAHSNRGPIQVHNPSGGVSLFEQHDFVAGEGYAWCVTLDLTAWEVGARHPLPYKSPSAHGQGDYWRKHGHAVNVGSLIKGDLIDWNVGAGHMSMFEKFEGGMIHSIDGNHGDRVQRAVRSPKLVRTAIHIPEDPKKLPPTPPMPFWVIATSANGHRQLLFTKYATEKVILNKILPPLVKKYGKAGITINRGGLKK